jgi:hypothetical protein
MPWSRIYGSRNPLSHTSSWRNAQLVKHRDNYALPEISVNRDSAFRTATGYGPDGRGVRVWVPLLVTILSSLSSPDRFLDPLSILSNVYQEGLSSGVKRPDLVAYHSPLTTAEVNKTSFNTSATLFIIKS